MSKPDDHDEAPSAAGTRTDSPEAAAPLELFPWNKQFETGIGFMDEQHRTLVRLLNELAQKLVMQSDALTLEDALRDLDDYANYHFAAEEDLMRQFLAGDDMESSHRSAHAGFLQQVARLRTSGAPRPEGEAIKQIVAYLCRWLAFHILDDDRRMAKVVLAIQDGVPLDVAKARTDRELSSAVKVLIDSILGVYEKLSSRTFQLMTEIVERKEVERQLLREQVIREKIIESLPGVFYMFDATGNFQAWNRNLERISGRSAAEIAQAHPLDFFDAEDKPPVAAAIVRGLESGRATVEAGLLGSDGNRIPYFFSAAGTIIDGRPVVIGLGVNITDRKQAEERIQQLAYFDALTGLPNRRMLADRLAQALSQARRHERSLAVMFLDVDNFKKVNDTLGHDFGDELLKEVAARLATCVRSGDTVARQGGDEFIIVLAEIAQPGDAALVAEKIVAVLGQPVCVAGTCLDVTISIGIAVYPVSGSDDAQELMRKADRAMYAAKAAGRNGYRFFGE